MALVLLSGLSVPCVSPPAALAEAALIGRSSLREPYAAHIAEAARRFRIPVSWITAVIHAESGGNPRAKSPVGAMGLMQIMPDTWTDLRARYGFGRDPYDPHENILAGTAYLREMFDRYGSIPAMLAAYNAGPGRYDEHLATGRSLPAETHIYVAQIARTLGVGHPSTAAFATRRLADWRVAPLFATSTNGVRRIDAVPSSRQSLDLPSPVPAQADRTIKPRSDGIFLVRNDAGMQQ